MNNESQIKGMNSAELSDFFHKLTVSFSPQVFRLAWRYLQDEELSRDMVQDVFTEVWLNLEKFENRSNIKTWIYRITVNKCLNFIKRHQRTVRIPDFIFDQQSDEQDTELGNMAIGQLTEDSVSIHFESKERKQIVAAAINRLPENQRTAFILYHYEELSYKEISETMDISVSSVESLMHRAKVNMRKFLLNYYENKF